MTSLYSLRSTDKSGEYIVMKFDADYEVESVYALNASLCVCPAGHRPTCRHRKMLPLFLAQHHVDDGWFLDWDTRLWRHPVGEPAPAQLADPLVLPSIAREVVLPPNATGEQIAEAFANLQTPMMDNIRKLAEQEEIQPPQTTPAPQAPAPAPEVSRSVGAGAPLKRRRITV